MVRILGVPRVDVLDKPFLLVDLRKALGRVPRRA
jgi:hypothetical protein